MVTAADAAGCVGSTSYTLVTTCPTITVTNPATATGTAGTAFSQTFTQSGGSGTVTFSTTSTLPAGLTLAANGTLSGTTTQAGTYPIVVKATDANGCTGSGATYNLVIDCQTITVTNPVTATGTEGNAFSQTFTASGLLGTVDLVDGERAARRADAQSLDGRPLRNADGDRLLRYRREGHGHERLLRHRRDVHARHHLPDDHGRRDDPGTHVQHGDVDRDVHAERDDLHDHVVGHGPPRRPRDQLLDGRRDGHAHGDRNVLGDDHGDGCRRLHGLEDRLGHRGADGPVAVVHGIGNTQFYVTGVAGAPTTPAVSSATALLNGAQPAGGVSVTAASCSTGGTLATFDAAGRFVFTPNVSATSATCSYTISSNTGGTPTATTATASLTFTLSGMVWYVDNATASGTNDGRSNTPFKTMTAVNTASTSNGDFIYVAKGTGSTTGAYAMKTSQQLIGAGATLNVGAGLLVVTGAAGNTPTLSGTLTLASSVVVDGIDMSTGSSTAVSGSGGLTGVTFAARNVASTTATAVNLNNVNTSTFTFRSISSTEPRTASTCPRSA